MSQMATQVSQRRSSHLGALLADGASILLAHLGVAAVLPGRPESLAVAFGTVLFFAGAEATGLYRSWRGEPLVSELRATSASWSVVAILVLAVVVATGRAGDPAFHTLYAWLCLAPLLLLLWRAVVRLGAHVLQRRGKNLTSVAIVGATPLGASLASLLVATPSLGLRFVGYYQDPAGGEPSLARPGVVGDLEQLVRDARTGAVEIVYVSMPPSAEVTVTSLLHRLGDTTCSVFVVPDLYVFNMLPARWTSIRGLPVVSITRSPFAGVGGLIKRLEDIVLGAFFLALTAVPMLLIAMGVALTSRGPVLFRQERYGLNGKRIDVLKFRTMLVSPKGETVQQATRGDSRVTRFGAFLRRTSLDELPQFFHVLGGSMSIVGPRPHAVAHNEQYRSLVHGYMLRHKVKPGITGWAQVNGWRGETETVGKMRGRIEYDLAYMRDWRVLLDLKIILMTILVVWTGRNAY